MRWQTYSGNDLLDALLVTFHFQKGLYLAYGEVFPVPKRNQLIKGTEKFVGISDNLSLIKSSACAGNDLSEQVQGVDVLENVGLLVGDEHHVELVKRLVDKSNIVLLNGSVLGAAVGQLWERGEEGFYPRPWHLSKLAGKDSFPPAGAD